MKKDVRPKGKPFTHKFKVNQHRKRTAESSRPPISLQISNNRHYKSGSHASTDYRRSMVVFMDKSVSAQSLIRLAEEMHSKFAKAQREKKVLFNNLSDSETYLFIVYYNEAALEHKVRGLLHTYGQQHVQGIISGKPTSVGKIF